MKKTTVILGITTAALATMVTVTGASAATAADCIPSPGTDSVFGPWVPDGYTDWTPNAATPDDPDSQAGANNVANLREIGTRESAEVSNGDGYEETILGTPGVWANFQPNDTHAPFVGPPEYPTDPRGSWNVHGDVPPGHEGSDGVYAQGNPDKGGDWFYRQAGTPDQTVVHEDSTHVEYRWVILERTVTEGTAPVTCDDAEQPRTDGGGETPETPADTPTTPVMPTTSVMPTGVSPHSVTSNGTPAVLHASASHPGRRPVGTVAAVPTVIHAGL